MSRSSLFVGVVVALTLASAIAGCGSKSGHGGAFVPTFDATTFDSGATFQ